MRRRGTAPSRARIEITPSRVELYASQSLALTATVYDGRGAVAADVVTWATANPAIAQVSAEGNLFAANRGETTMTATAGRVSQSASVTVVRDSVPPTLDQVTTAPALVIYALCIAPSRAYDTLDRTCTGMVRTLMVNDEAAHRSSATTRPRSVRPFLSTRKSHRVATNE